MADKKRKKSQLVTGGIPAPPTPRSSLPAGPLYLFRKAVLHDPALQDRLRSPEACEPSQVAYIANEYLRKHVQVALSPDFERGSLRDTAEIVFENLFRITEADLTAYLEANTNEEGEFLLGQDELAMVAGSTRLADSTNSCSYGSGCGSCGCSSSLSCVCK